MEPRYYEPSVKLIGKIFLVSGICLMLVGIIVFIVGYIIFDGEIITLFGMLCLIPVILGIIFGAIGFGMNRASKSIGTRELMQVGLAIELPVIEIVKVKMYRKGPVYYRLRTEYVDNTGVKTDVYTDLLSIEPSSYLLAHNGNMIVYIDRENPKKYYIDSDEIYDFLECNRFE